MTPDGVTRVGAPRPRSIDALLRRLREAPPVIVLIGILAATVVYYAPTLNDWFFADDLLFVRASQTTSWTTWIGQAFDYRDARPVAEINQYRPMYAATFRLEYELFGLHPWAYHAVNLAVHLGTVTVLWLIARRLPMPAWGAHLAAAIFALHPTYTEAVAWIANGNTPMAVFFALLAFWLLMKFTDGGAWRAIWFGASLLSLTAALLYHPVVLPYAAAMLVWYQLLGEQRAGIWHPRRWLPLVPYIAVIAPYVLIHRWVRDHDFAEQIKYQFGDHMFGIAVDYLGMALHAEPDSRTAPIAVALMVLATVLALATTAPRALALGLLAVIWYYAALAPDTLFVFGAYPRLMYAPGVPLALLLSVACVRGVDALSSERAHALMMGTRPLVYAALTAAVVLFAVAVRPRGRDLPPDASVISHEAARNEQLIAQLRREVPAVPQGGTLYVVNPPPYTVHLGLENILRSLVRIYYGEIAVEPVPAANEQQVRDTLGPDDRIFVFQ